VIEQLETDREIAIAEVNIYLIFNIYDRLVHCIIELNLAMLVGLRGFNIKGVKL
jgi:hypothetical protein